MAHNPSEESHVVQTYAKRSKRYDSNVKIFDLFRSMGFDIPAWREAAIQDLHLKPGDIVIDIGCGTGLTFPSLCKAVGPSGKIIGIDISEGMLKQAQQLIAANGWLNVELVNIDISQYDFPIKANGILSSFALILIPDSKKVIAKACQALLPGGRLSILDMAWPESWPIYWWHAFFWLKTFGVTQEIMEAKPWEAIWQEIDQNLKDVVLKRFWLKMMYRVSGTNP